MRHSWMAVLMVSALACSVRGQSRDNESGVLPEKLDLRRVALFKNGFGFFVGRATLSTGGKESSFLLPAVPVQGTFWLSHPPDVNLVSVVAEKVDSEGERLEAITIPEIIKANVGKRVRITIDEKPVTGRITGFTEDRRWPRIMSYAPGVPEGGMDRPEIWPPYEAGLVLISVRGGGTLSLDPRSIQHVTFLDDNVQRHFARTMDAVAVHVQAAESPRGQSMVVSFLAKGITWTPSYLLDISGQEKASLSAKALIVNEVYDLSDVTVQLATGFPRLQFAEVRSPIGMKEPLAQFLAALSGGEQDQSQVMKTYAMAESARMGFGGAAMDVAPAYGTAEGGITAEDLFLYPAGRITLPKDRVAYLPLFTEAVPCEDLYEWSIPDYADETGRFLFRGEQPNGKKEQEVWHSIRLKNTTRVPWTPAPAEAIQNNMIVGQAEMPYTPAGDEATLRISRAADITAEQQEFEVERKRGARQVSDIYYDLVTVRGELTITNFKEQAVALEINKMLSGEVVSTDPQAKVEKLAARIQGINGRRKLTWTIEIDPGQTQKATYTYEVYVRGERVPDAGQSFRGGNPEPGAS